VRAPAWMLLVPALLATPASSSADEATLMASFAPPLFGSETVERARAGSREAPAAAREAWSAFLAAHPGPWRADWDARAGTPRQIWGASIPFVRSEASAAAVESAVRRLFAGELAALARVPDARLRTSVLAKRGDTWFVRFDRTMPDGTPVAGAFAEARITNGRLVLVRIETHPDATAPARVVGATRAVALAEDALRPFREIANSAAAPVIAPIAAGGGWTYRPAWEVVTRARSGEIWRSRVDAVHGELLARHSLTPSLDGRITAMVEPRTVGDVFVEQALPHVLVETTGGATAVASTDGTWTFADPGPLSLDLVLSGPFIDVRHQLLPEATASFVAAPGTSDFVWTAGANATQSEIAAYRHVATVREWALSLVPSETWLQAPVTVRVGVAGECNAMYDGTILLYGEGANCNDTARIADVVYHEYGHGFHEHVRVSGTMDPVIGEGIGDYVSATITGSERIGLALLKAGPGDGALRDVGEDRVYPQDLVGEIHTDGLIFAGAMWDARNALIAIHGDAIGRRIADELFAEIVVAGPSLDQVFVEALLADDDDANLANGTPNRCLLEAELGRHGLAGASGLFSLAHTEVLGPFDGDRPVPIVASRSAEAALCGENEVTSASLFWSVDDGDVSSVEMAPSLEGVALIAWIPPAKGTVRYWFEATLESGTTVLTPPAAPKNVFAFHSGPLEVVWSDDFETLTGWTSGGPGDDWQIGAPQGLGGDPSSAYSGTNVLGNRLDGDGRYVADADSYVDSPVIDCGRCRGALLQFRRHGKVQQAVSDRVTAGIGTLPVWQNEQGLTYDEATVDDPMWSFQEYDVSELADRGAAIRIRFTLESDNFFQLGGMTIDDVAIVMPVVGTDDGGGLFGCSCSLVPAARPSLGSWLLVSLAGVSAIVARRAAIRRR